MPATLESWVKLANVMLAVTCAPAGCLESPEPEMILFILCGGIWTRKLSALMLSGPFSGAPDL
jgi:hypothetical protein